MCSKIMEIVSKAISIALALAVALARLMLKQAQTCKHVRLLMSIPAIGRLELYSFGVN